MPCLTIRGHLRSLQLLNSLNTLQLLNLKKKRIITKIRVNLEMLKTQTRTEIFVKMKALLVEMSLTFELEAKN